MDDGEGRKADRLGLRLAAVRAPTAGLDAGLLEKAATLMGRSCDRTTIFGKRTMPWDEIKNFFAGPYGPIASLIGLAVIFGRQEHWRTAAPLGLTYAALTVARHFEFTISEQYALLVGVYFGVQYCLPQSK
jgi:hypothetical protein